MTQPPERDPLAPQDRAPAVSFRNVPPGTTQRFRVLEYATQTQARDFDTRQPKFWPDGNPVMSVVIKVADDNGEARTLWAQIPSGMYAALVAAQQALGNGRRISPGDILTVTYTHDIPNKEKPHLNPQKQYRIDVTPGDPLASQANGHQQPNVAPQPPMPTPSHAPAPPPPQPARAGGFTEPPPF